LLLSEPVSNDKWRGSGEWWEVPACAAIELQCGARDPRAQLHADLGDQQELGESRREQANTKCGTHPRAQHQYHQRHRPLL
jgi:hypothetical protein